MEMLSICCVFLTCIICCTAFEANYTRSFDCEGIPDLTVQELYEYKGAYPTNVTVQMVVTDIHSVSETAMWRDYRLDFMDLGLDIDKLELDPSQTAGVWQPDTYFTNKKKEYSVDLLLRQWWWDYRLDFMDLGLDIDKLELDPSQTAGVWQPDTYFTNEKKASIHDVTTTNKLMHVMDDGTVITSMRIAMTLICQMNLHMFPFDSQKCAFNLQSFAYTNRNINLDWDELEPFHVHHTELPQFEMTDDVHLSDYEDTFPITGTFSAIKAEVYFRRKSGHYFLHVFVPSIMLVSLSWVSFWVDPVAVPARVSLGVTCVLTMTTQSSGTRATLPPVSYVKAIDVWMMVCLLFVFAALLEFAYVNVLLRRHHKKKSKFEDNETLQPKQADDYRRARRIDIISRVAFPGTFCVFLIVFALVCAFGGDTGVKSSN